MEIELMTSIQAFRIYWLSQILLRETSYLWTTKFYSCLDPLLTSVSLVMAQALQAPGNEESLEALDH